jgi:hypothetical protein
VLGGSNVILRIPVATLEDALRSGNVLDCRVVQGIDPDHEIVDVQFGNGHVELVLRKRRDRPAFGRAYDLVLG